MKLLFLSALYIWKMRNVCLNYFSDVSKLPLVLLNSKAHSFCLIELDSVNRWKISHILQLMINPLCSRQQPAEQWSMIWEASSLLHLPRIVLLFLLLSSFSNLHPHWVDAGILYQTWLVLLTFPHIVSIFCFNHSPNAWKSSLKCWKVGSSL